VIEDYVVVNGSGIGGIEGIAGKGLGIGGGIGAFVVWNVKVDTLEVCVISPRILSFSRYQFWFNSELIAKQRKWVL